MSRSEFMLVAEHVLRRTKRPMSAREIWDVALREGLVSDRLAGQTPIQTLKSKLSVDIRFRKDDSVFVRTAPGRFFLRDLLGESLAAYESEPWQPPPSKEKVIVFPTAVLDKIGRFQGVRTSVERIFADVFRPGTCFAMDRAAAEADDDHKQVLTYIMVRRREQLLAYRRGVYNRTEDMLRGRDCVGFGGHVNDLDFNLFSGSSDEGMIKQAAVRELAEELDLPTEDSNRLLAGQGLRIVGALNDDSSAIGRRHFAVVFEYEVSGSSKWDSPTRGENSITQLRWLDAASESVGLGNFEYWSQLVMRSFTPEIVRLQPSYAVIHKTSLRPPHVLCLVGPIGSGKTEASRVLVAEYGYTEVNSGRVLAKLMGIPPVPKTPRPSMQALALEFISKKGACKRLAEGLHEESLHIDGGRILIDGIRQVTTLKELALLVAPARIGVVYVHTTPDVAYQLYRRREKPDAQIEDFLQVWESPVEQDAAVLIREADAVLYNWFGRSRYVSVVRELMSDIGVPRAG